MDKQIGKPIAICGIDELENKNTYRFDRHTKFKEFQRICRNVL